MCKKRVGGGKGERRKEKGERRKEKGERRKEKGERRKEKGERRKEKEVGVIRVIGVIRVF